MNDILKQRLVGALILVALGVVFWPIIFVQTEGPRVADQPTIPPPPMVSTDVIEAPNAEGLRASPPLTASNDVEGVASSTAQDLSVAGEGEIAEPAETVEPATEPAMDAQEQEARSEPPQQLAMDSDGVPIAWTLQVATVSAADKAETLRRRLLEMNQKAYITSVSSGGKTLYRVCVGPKFERIELEKLQSNIDAEFGVHTMVVRYIP